MITKIIVRNQQNLSDFFLNFLPLGPIINIQKIRHFTHFEIIKHSFGIITPVVKVTVPEKEIKKY